MPNLTRLEETMLELAETAESKSNTLASIRAENELEDLQNRMDVVAAVHDERPDFNADQLADYINFPIEFVTDVLTVLARSQQETTNGDHNVRPA